MSSQRASANSSGEAHQPSVRVRGTRDGIVFYLPDGLASDALVAQVSDAVDESRDFFKDAQVVIDYGMRPPNVDEIERLTDALTERGLGVRAFTATAPEYRAMLHQWGHTPLRVVERPRRTSPAIVPEREATYIKRTLRSGAAAASESDLVIVGDVNAGAQISAVGDIIVWGALRGTAQTTTDGMICALKLQPTQLRIGGLVARPPDERQRRQRDEGPQCAFIDGGQIVVEPWRGLERRGT
jgi:septum site-determining protein MinC